MAELRQGTPTKQAEKSPEPPKERLPVMPSPKGTPQQRRRFSQEESEDVKKFFQEQIENGMGVSLREWQLFLRYKKLNRTPKNIQDKVRNLI